MKKKKLGFTLIELLVAIAIIAIIATITVVALQNSRANARDAKRLADVKQMQTALELYFNDNNSYPTSITSTIATSNVVYMTSIPVPPTPVDGDCTTATNAYAYSSNGSTYSITFCLGGKTSGLSSGNKIATRDGVNDITSWACGDILADARDSQEYPTVQIGDQCWMAKNLAYLPVVHDTALFISLGQSLEPTYSVHNYNGTDLNLAKSSNKYIVHGTLYNWFATVATSSFDGNGVIQGVCPSGWHVPSVDEFRVLATYLGGASVAGGKLKQTGTTNWQSPNTGATNESGFNATESGRRYTSGSFNNGYAYFWSSSPTPSDSNRSSYYTLRYNSIIFQEDNSNGDRIMGFSVRCLKD